MCKVSHWPEAVDCTHFPFSLVLEVTERAQPLFYVFRRAHSIRGHFQLSVNPARLHPGILSACSTGQKLLHPRYGENQSM